MIRINLHDYRDELRKIEIQKRVVKSLAIIIVAIFFILASWLNEQAKLDLVKSETRKLQSQVAALKSQVEKVKKMVLEKSISKWLNQYLEDNNLETFVVGISGGIDSAVTSTLCAMTGKKTIVTVMPIHQNPEETERGVNHCRWLKEKYPRESASVSA